MEKNGILLPINIKFLGITFDIGRKFSGCAWHKTTFLPSIGSVLEKFVEMIAVIEFVRGLRNDDPPIRQEVEIVQIPNRGRCLVVRDFGAAQE